MWGGGGVGHDRSVGDGTFFDDIRGGDATLRGVTAGAACPAGEISCMLTATKLKLANTAPPPAPTATTPSATPPASRL